MSDWQHEDIFRVTVFCEKDSTSRSVRVGRFSFQADGDIIGPYGELVDYHSFPTSNVEVLEEIRERLNYGNWDVNEIQWQSKEEFKHGGSIKFRRDWTDEIQ